MKLRLSFLAVFSFFTPSQNKTAMRKLPSLLLFSCCVLLLFHACRKTDAPASSPSSTPEERYFALSSTAPVQVKAVAEAVNKQNEKFNFLSSVIKKAGYPHWDKAKLVSLESARITGRGDAGNAGGDLVFVPFALDSANQVGAVLRVQMNSTDTIYRMLYAPNYRQFGYDTSDNNQWNAWDVFHLFVLFDNSVFGHTRFVIKDDRLYPRRNDSSQVVMALKTDGAISGVTGRSALYSHTECNEFTHCDIVLDPLKAARLLGSADCYDVRICTTWYYDEGGSSGGTSGGWTGTGDGTGGSGSTGGGGGTSGSDGWWSGGTTPCSGLVARAGFRTIDGCDPGWVSAPTSTDDPKDPCITARSGATKATELSKSPTFLQAKTTIQNADPAVEHTIGFGKDAAGNITASSMQNGSGNFGSVPDMLGGFADIHNHPRNTEPSAGDLYSLIQKNTTANGYTTRFVMTGGTIYAFVVTDPTLAASFIAKYPKVQIGSYPPEFPSPIFDEYKDASLWLQGNLGYSSTLADALAMAFIFEKHNAGIAILKQDINSDFKILRAKQTSTSGTLGAYEQVACN